MNHNTSAILSAASIPFLLAMASSLGGCAPVPAAEGDELDRYSESELTAKEQPSSGLPGMETQVNAIADIPAGTGFSMPGFVSDGSMFTYTHDWGDWNGTVTMNLTWPDVRSWSHVFVSTSEGHMGAAPYTVQNVVPWEGGVSVRVYIGWEQPIRLYTHYLVING